MDVLPCLTRPCDASCLTGCCDAADINSWPRMQLNRSRDMNHTDTYAQISQAIGNVVLHVWSGQPGSAPRAHRAGEPRTDHGRRHDSREPDSRQGCPPPPGSCRVQAAQLTTNIFQVPIFGKTGKIMVGAHARRTAADAISAGSCIPGTPGTRREPYQCAAVALRFQPPNSWNRSPKCPLSAKIFNFLKLISSLR